MANRKLLPQSEPRLSGTLSVLLTDSATTAVFSNPPDETELPTYFLLEPDSDDNREKVRAVDVAGNNVTIERGVDNGGVGVEHQANSTYKQTFTAQHWDKVVEALEQGWLSEDSGLAITKVNDTTLRIAGYDRTTYYPTGRVLLINTTVKCKVVSASYADGNTNVVISGGTVPTTITSLKLILGPVENPLVGINEIPRYGEDAEESDTYEITLNPAPSAYFAGMTVIFKATTVNTGACTLNVNSLGAKAIKTPEGEDLANAQIPAGSIAVVVYDGTNFILSSIGGLASKSIAYSVAVQMVVFNFTDDAETGDGKFYFLVPAKLNGMNLTSAVARVITAGTTNTMDIQIANVTDAVDMLSTKLTIDSGETSSSTAATPVVIDATKDDVVTGDLLRIDVDAVHTTKAKGLIVTLGFNLP